MSIKQIQKKLGVVVDGVWGNKSQSALSASDLKLDYSWDKMRAAFGGFNQSQVDGFDTIKDAVNADKRAKNPLYLAYMLATAWHETARTMQPIAEYGKGRGHKYGENIDIDGSRYQGLPHRYYGRGYVQLTWLTNYKRMGKICGADFVNNPNLTLQPHHAANIMLHGMLDGLFTGKSLSSYIKHGHCNEFVNARKIINGTDKADLIAEYAVKFLDCLVLN